MRRLLLTLATLACALTPATAGAATLNATPSTFAAQYAAAQPGDTVALASGSYGTFSGSLKSGEVTIREQDGATASMAIRFSPASNLTLDGLTITDGYLTDSRTKNITIRNSLFDRSRIVFRAESGSLVNANILLERNQHLGTNVCAGCWDARVHISGRTSEPTGITIRDSLFAGGDADGIQNGGNGVQIVNNEFRDICQGCTSSDAHTDSVQLYGSRGTVLRRNFFYNVDMGNPGAYDELDHEVIEDNVVVSSRYPFQAQLLSDNGSVVRHNTFVQRSVTGGGCDYNLTCGIVRMGNKDADPPSTGTVFKDNILASVSLTGSNPSFAANDYNLYTAFKGGGANSILAQPVYVGGALPTTYEGFRLAAGSPGKGTASDGLDRGARIGEATPPPPPPPPPVEPPPPPPPPPVEPPPPPPAEEPPAAAYIYTPASPTTGQEVTFDGSGSTCPSTPCTYAWEDDGTDGAGGTQWPLGTGQTLRFTFGSAGDKHVRLTVTDAQARTDSTVKTIAVTEAAPPPEPEPVYNPVCRPLCDETIARLTDRLDRIKVIANRSVSNVSTSTLRNRLLEIRRIAQE